MKIKSIEAKNIKGSTFSYTLQPVTVFVGENASGKTAIAEALRLAAIGYVPGLSTKPSDIFAKLGSREELDVRMEFDNGQVNRVKLVTKRGGGVSRSEVSKQDVVIPNIILDPAEYFGGTSRERVGMMFSHLASGLDDGLEKIKTAANAIRLQLDAPKQASGWPIVERFVSEFDFYCSEQREANGTIADLYDAIEDHLAEQHTEYTAAVDRARSALAESYSQQAAAGLSATWTADDEKEMRDAEAGRDEITRQLAVHNYELEKENSRDARIEQLKRSVAAAVGKLEAVEKSQERLKRARQLQAEAQAGAKPLRATIVEELAQAQRELNDVLRTVPNGYHELSQAQNALAAFHAEKASIECQRKALKNKLGATSLQHDEQLRKLDLHKCPHCGKLDETPKAMLQERFQDEFKALSEELAALDRRTTSNAEAIGVCENKCAEWKALLAQSELQLAQWAKELNYKIANLTAEKAAFDVQSQALVDVATLVSVIEREVEVFQQGAEAATKAKEELEQLEGVTSRRVETEARIAELNTQDMQLLVKIDKLKERKFNAAASSENRKQRAKSEEALIELELTAEVLKLLKKSITTLKTSEIEAVVGSFMAKAQAFIEPVLGRKLEYRDGDIGFFRDGTWVSHKVMSGSEQALAYIGVQLAFAQASPVKFIVLDELGIFSRRTKARLFEALAFMLREGTLDNAICFDVEDSGLVPCVRI